MLRMSDELIHLLALGKLYWPNVHFYRKQKTILESLIHNDETVVVAGNKLGKDYIAGFVSLMFFLSPQSFFKKSYVKSIEAMPGSERAVHTRRIITTSVAEHHLNVLWGEIGRFLDSAEIPLMATRGGPLTINSLEIRFNEEADLKKPYNYLVGRVSKEGEGLAGHHAAYTLCIIDEASGIDDKVYSFAQGWAQKFFIFGNPNPTENFFKRMVKAGDIK